MATRIYKTPFAATGDKEVLATADQPDGKVSLQAGWTPDYELPSDNANYRPVGRAEMNGILSEITESLGDLQLHGFPQWVAVDGGWPKGAILRNAAGTGFWLNGVDNNTENPDIGGSNWVAVINNPAVTGSAGIIAISTTAQAQAMTDDLTAITPKKLADALGGGNQSLTPNGFRKLPGGYIEQWGFATINPDIDTLTNFPIPFPNEVLAVYASNATTITQTTRAAKNGTSLTSFFLYRATTSGSIYWRAIGR
ncbi:gp53-like domain-containing protein [Achromobacter xylosoxidans]|uniref:gp53-like domain-containing protein n=1 Tax=Alcaligenes xylosoxydans xylosoxydans TaxID=85698 RepID=UPI0009713BC8|nr:hypothetical protein [Achromobacter xylosoxidans]OMG80585.1 hypothetical protein BIZ53_30290 [Achromobacter xylosoxidans]